ncbi:MAG TPA: helix-turn-helix transcriptional regulator [Noviherbaspirillum sp.]
MRKRLGQNIAQARKDKGWMQAELAERLGMEPVSLSRIETGNSLPGIERVIEIAGVLDVSFYQLFDGISQNLTDQAAEIGGCIKRLSPADRTLVVTLVKQLTERLAKK